MESSKGYSESRGITEMITRESIDREHKEDPCVSEDGKPARVPRATGYELEPKQDARISTEPLAPERIRHPRAARGL